LYQHIQRSRLGGEKRGEEGRRGWIEGSIQQILPSVQISPPTERHNKDASTRIQQNELSVQPPFYLCVIVGPTGRGSDGDADIPRLECTRVVRTVPSHAHHLQDMTQEVAQEGKRETGREGEDVSTGKWDVDVLYI
jgi:hypothetical protein